MTYVLFAENVCQGQVLESKNANRSAFCNRASSLLKLVTAKLQSICAVSHPESHRYCPLLLRQPRMGSPQAQLVPLPSPPLQFTNLCPNLATSLL